MVERCDSCDVIEAVGKWCRQSNLFETVFKNETPVKHPGTQIAHGKVPAGSLEPLRASNQTHITYVPCEVVH